MACVDNDQGPLGALATLVFGPAVGALFTEFVSEWLPLLLNVLLAVKMLEAQEEAEREMNKIAKKSLCAAEEQFDAYMLLRGFDSKVYEALNNQPTYEKVDRSIHAIQALKQYTSIAKKAMAKTSRFDCGNRRQIAYDATAASLLGTASEREAIAQFEFAIEDSYVENYYDSIVSASTQNHPSSLSGAFNSSSAIWGEQFNNANTQAVGAIASTSYYLGRIF